VASITVYEIAKQARVSQIILSRFLSGERDIRMATADKLARVLALILIKR
jgi:DNA-binding LacI/PurR family transcriptional regulator